MGFKNKSEGKKEGRKQKGQKAAEQNQRIRKYKKEQQVKKRAKKAKEDQNKITIFNKIINRITIKTILIVKIS